MLRCTLKCLLIGYLGNSMVKQKSGLRNYTNLSYSHVKSLKNYFNYHKIYVPLKSKVDIYDRKKLSTTLP